MARVYVERRELPAELIRLLDANPAAAECTPPLDIIETDAAIEAILDLPGVAPTAVEIVFSRNVLLVTGQKLPGVCEHVDAGFHIAERESLDYLIANVENSADGFGVTGDIADTILGYGVDAMTTGNHVWDKKEVLDYIPRQSRLLRPANFPAGVPGRGSYVGQTRSGEP